ncbi:MAG TPA: DUF4912 domain-containing protein [Candidatus Paceibacterota bacterium]|nr:DUF4912 domain-containing protein [Candidatus Paceibacterota bacterium]
MMPKKKSAKKKAAASPRLKRPVAARKKPARAVTRTAAKKAAPKTAAIPAPKPVVAEPSPALKKRTTTKAKAAAKFEPAGIPKIVEAVAPKVEALSKPEVAPERISKAPRKTVAHKKASTKVAAEPPVAAPVKNKPEAPQPATRKVISVTPVSVPPPTPPRRKAPERIPIILLEGDQPEPVRVSGPGERYSLGPKPPVEALESSGELPSAYGTQQVLLAARDPHWLYAHWDLTDEQQRRYNALAADRHLVLRVHANEISGKPEQEVRLHPESRHWFIHVERAGVKYQAELGYYRTPGKWVGIAMSTPTLTPPDAISEDTSAEFATIPFELPMAQLLSLVKGAVEENVPLAQALQQIQTESLSNLPKAAEPPVDGSRTEISRGNIPDALAPRPASATREWTPAQERALAEIISMDHVRRVWMGSMEITEVIRRQMIQELAAKSATGLAAGENAPTSPAFAPGAAEMPGAISSPAGGAKSAEKGFWFNVNAELIIYGATESDATVTIGGRQIRLRPDGSFSYRFALPDGHYELPIVAISADQTDGRAAELAFSRSTDLRGDVGVHPQDSELKRPEAANL